MLGDADGRPALASEKDNMKTDSTRELAERTGWAPSLTKVRAENEHVKELVKKSAEELSSVITVIKLELSNEDRLLMLESAIEKIEAVESKVREASEKLLAVNRALEDEVRKRNTVDHQLAAAIGQQEGSRHAAFHDVLTGLPNRALFNDRLEHGLAQAKRHGWTLAVMFLDLDEFKNINDTYGHDAGDLVLQTTAQRLKENTRGGDDTVSRHGGDEFLYLLTEIQDQKDIVMIADKIAKVVQAPCSMRVRDLDITLSIGASIGVSIFPKDGATGAALVKSADEAMYRAKQSKSGRVHSSKASLAMCGDVQTSR